VFVNDVAQTGSVIETKRETASERRVRTSPGVGDEGDPRRDRLRVGNQATVAVEHPRHRQQVADRFAVEPGAVQRQAATVAASDLRFLDA